MNSPAPFWIFLCSLLLSFSSFAADLSGKFQCRRFPSQSDSKSAYPEPVAYIWVQGDGTYEFLDLTTTKGKTSGRYVYDAKSQQIQWESGDLAEFVGHYLPNVAGSALITLNFKKDPQGHSDGTMPCIRVSDKPTSGSGANTVSGQE